MKILLVNTRFYYGDGTCTYMFNLANLLRRKGHDISFFAMQDKGNLPDPNDDLFVSHIDYRQLNQNKSLSNSIKVFSRSIYSLEAKRKFSALIDREKPDVIHLQNIHNHITSSIIIEAKDRGIPIIWTAHDYKLICPNTHFFSDKSLEICEACRGGKYYQAIFHQCKKGSILASTMAAIEAYAHQLMRVKECINMFVTPSEFLRSKLLENKYPHDKVQHIPLFLPNFLDEPFVNDKAYLLFLGRIEPIKGIWELLEACRLIPNVKVIIAGRCEETIKQIFLTRLPNNVEYVGLKIGEELNELRQNARAIISPSIWYENQPFSILEAFAYGKPVIATNIGGMRELIGNDERGVLVEPGVIDQLAKAIEWMFLNPVESRIMGKNALEYVKAVHSPDAHYNLLEKVYSSVSN